MYFIWWWQRNLTSLLSVSLWLGEERGHSHTSSYRICAVYGGVYILGQVLEKYTVEEGNCTGVVTTDGQAFTASHIITGFDYLSSQWDLSSVDDHA